MISVAYVIDKLFLSDRFFIYLEHVYACRRIGAREHTRTRPHTRVGALAYLSIVQIREYPKPIAAQGLSAVQNPIGHGWTRWGRGTPGMGGFGGGVYA